MLAIFLDQECTGLDPLKHRVIDIAIQAIDMSTGKIKGRYQSLIKITPAEWDARDPVSMEINGYSLDTITSGQSMDDVRSDIFALFNNLGVVRGKAVFICQNPAFDRSFFTQIIDVYTQERLQWPYHWLDFASMYWALIAKKEQSIGKTLPEVMSLSKNEIARIYNLPPESSPHRAMNGVDHLILCYKTVIGIPQPIEV